MSTFDISTIVQQLCQDRDHWREQQNRTDPGHREFPARAAIAQALEGLKGVLYPLRLGPPDLRHASEDFYVGHTLDTALQVLQTQAQIELHYRHRSTGAAAQDHSALALQTVQAFAQQLPRLRQLLDTDVLAAFHGDPAARSVDEVVLSYPGVLTSSTTASPTPSTGWTCRCWRASWPSWRTAKRGLTSTPVRRLAPAFSLTTAQGW